MALLNEKKSNSSRIEIANKFTDELVNKYFYCSTNKAAIIKIKHLIGCNLTNILKRNSIMIKRNSWNGEGKEGDYYADTIVEFHRYIITEILCLLFTGKPHKSCDRQSPIVEDADADIVFWIAEQVGWNIS